MVGEHLVHADASLEDRALLQCRPREDVAGLPGMDADAGGVLVEEPRDDVEPGLEWRHGLEGRAQLHLAAGPLAHQCVGADPVAHEERGEPLGERGDG